MIVGKESGSKGALLAFPASDLGAKNDFGRINAVGAGQFAALALAAELHPFIDGRFTVQPESLRVGPRLFRPWEKGISPENRAILHADRTSYTILEHDDDSASQDCK